MPSSKLVKNLSPEEEELQRKKEELAALEDQLAELRPAVRPQVVMDDRAA